MLSKRNFAMMMTMILVILVLFLSSVVLKEYFNDYDVNHAVSDEPPVEQIESGKDDGKGNQADITSAESDILFIGAKDNGYHDAMKEWAGYRKKSFSTARTLTEMRSRLKSYKKDKPYVLVDGELLVMNTEASSDMLTEYVKEGGVVIFYRLPSYQAIEQSKALQNLLGIQHLRAESVRLQDIRLYSGFLLGGETHYSFVDVQDPKVVDMERNVPWYDISSRTKSYMVGFISEEEKVSMNLENEDLPAIIWRSSLGKGSVFAVNGDYMKGETSLGLLDAMVYETENYVVYPVVNAQNFTVAGFPDLTVENEDRLAEVYGMTSQQFCRDILWPSLVAATQGENWKITSFVYVKQRDDSGNEPKEEDFIDYLKYFNEESTEAGISLGRIESTDINRSVMEEADTLKRWNLDYVFAGGYVRNENKDKLASLIDKVGNMEHFGNIRTVVGEYDEDTSILGWLSSRITVQNTTTDAYRHSYKDSLRLKSIETALGYSNVQADMYRILWPESEKDEWQSVAEKMAANIDTYWKPFAAFDKTTISESDARVRDYLNGTVKSRRMGNRISIETENFSQDAYLLLRTHGEYPKKMTGGTWKEVENDTYLLTLTEDNASVVLESKIDTYYKE